MADNDANALSFANKSGSIPNHHDAQMELPPGDYDLRVVVSDGTKFGRAEVPLTVDSYDGQHLGMSSIAICKEFHDHDRPTKKKGAKSLSPPMADFVPLVSKGMEFTPTGDMMFRKFNRDKLFVYYEIYEPLLASAPATTVQARLRIINTKTGELETDTSPRSTATWVQIGKSVIPVSQEVRLKELHKGSYRIEVQASDSTGRSTPWRKATFTVQ